MPYQPCLGNLPEFMPKSKFADHPEFFSVFQGIPHLTSAEMMPNPSYDPTFKNLKWEVKICHKGNIVTVQPKHLVMATGGLGPPKIPRFEGMNVFKGPIIHRQIQSPFSGAQGERTSQSSKITGLSYWVWWRNGSRVNWLYRAGIYEICRILYVPYPASFLTLTLIV